MNEYKSLIDKIKISYEQGVTIEEAERIAGEFLYVQLQLSEEYRSADLDARMKKAGLKAIKAAVYLDEAGKTEKKPSDTYLLAKVDTNELVSESTKLLDEAEVILDQLNTFASVFREAHIHFRSIAKGTFNG